MIIFGDKLDMKWNFLNGIPHGNGYGIGEKFIVVGEFINGRMWGDVNVFDKPTGKRIMRAHFENSKPEGEYTMYSGDYLETGIYKDGKKHFYIKKHLGKMYEYGFCRDNKLHGYGSVKTETGIYTSPYWDKGIINGLGAIEDYDNNIIFYGIFENGIPVRECNDMHPLLLDKYDRAREDNYCDLPNRCAEFALA